jgi:hypothetical protein
MHFSLANRHILEKAINPHANSPGKAVVLADMIQMPSRCPVNVFGRFRNKRVAKIARFKRARLDAWFPTAALRRIWLPS